MMYLGGVRPFSESSQNRKEMISEAIVYFCSHLIFAILNEGTLDEFRSIMGWALIGLCMLSIVFNLFYVLVGTLEVAYSLFLCGR